jgi:ribosomal protein S18 acetylase RimI-like enzyme
MTSIRIVDVTDDGSFGLIPPCADGSFDHRTCDYWEDADRGSKAHRPSWLGPAHPDASPATSARRTGNPFLDDAAESFNPFVPSGGGPSFNPFAREGDEPVENPFAPPPKRSRVVGSDAPRKLVLLGRGLGVFGSYAKVLVADDRPVAYTQFGPLSAYPRALRLRDLYPQLPDAPLPAVITCIATTREARHEGYALQLVRAVCDDLAERGFAAVESYPERHTSPDATSAATAEFWIAAGFAVAVEDERYPVLRRELE